MGQRLGDQDGYPAGVSNAHPHFHDEQIECPVCGRTTVVGPECEHCGAELEGDTVRDLLEAAQEPPEWG